MFVAYWRPWTTLTIGVGCDAVGTWPGMSGTRLVGSGTLLTSFGAVSDTPTGSPCGWIRIGDKPGLEICWLVRSWPTPSPGFRLKVAEIHDMYMAVSGGSMCEEVHPCRVNMIYSNSFIPCRGVIHHTCFHHLASAHDMCSADFKRKPTWV